MRRFPPPSLVLALLVGAEGCGDPGARAAWPSAAEATASAPRVAASIPPPDPNAPLIDLPPLETSKPTELRDGVCAVHGAWVSALALSGGDAMASLMMEHAGRATVCGADILADGPTAILARLSPSGPPRWTWSGAGVTVEAGPVFSGDAVWAVLLHPTMGSDLSLGLLSLDAATGERRFEITWHARSFAGLAPLGEGAVAIAAMYENDAELRGRTTPAGGYVARVERDGVVAFAVSARRVWGLASSGDVLVTATEKRFGLERLDPRTGRSVWSAAPPDDPTLGGLAVGEDGRVAVIGTTSGRGGMGLGTTGSGPRFLFSPPEEKPTAVLGVWSASGEFLHPASIESWKGAWGRSVAFVRGEIAIDAELRGKGTFGALSVDRAGSLLAVASLDGVPLRLVATSFSTHALAGSADGFALATSRGDAAALGAIPDPDAEEVIVFRRGPLPSAAR